MKHGKVFFFGMPAVLLAFCFAFAGCNPEVISNAKVKVRISSSSGGEAATTVNAGVIYAVPYDKENIGSTDMFYYTWYLDGTEQGEGEEFNIYYFAVPSDASGKQIKVRLRVKDLIQQILATAESEPVTVN